MAPETASTGISVETKADAEAEVSLGSSSSSYNQHRLHISLKNLNRSTGTIISVLVQREKGTYSAFGQVI